jgi:hypothetical protein
VLRGSDFNGANVQKQNWSTKTKTKKVAYSFTGADQNQLASAIGFSFPQDCILEFESRVGIGKAI